MQDMETTKEEMHVQGMLSEGSQNTILPVVLEAFGRWLLNAFSFFGVTNMILCMIVCEIQIEERTLYAIWTPLSVLYNLFAGMVFWRYQGMPYRLVGRQGKAVVDLMALGAAIMLRLYLSYDGCDFRGIALLILVALTLYLLSWGQILHLTWDIRQQDVLLQILMEVATYITADMLCVFFVIFFCCVICY